MTYFERLAERFVSARRLERMRAVLAERTLWVTPVFVDVQKAHNASAERGFVFFVYFYRVNI